jgi:flagellar biosynthesis protein FliR
MVSASGSHSLGTRRIAVNNPGDVLMFGGLVMARIMPVIMLCPLFGGRAIIAPVKIILGILFSLLIIPFLRIDESLHLLMQSPCIIIIFFKEIMVGFMLGFASALPLYSLESAGACIDIQQNTLGVALGAQQLHESSSVFGSLMYYLGLMIFFAIDGHHYVIQALFKSLILLPVSTVPGSGNSVFELAQSFIRLTADFLVIVLQLSAPVIVTLFLLDVLMAMINKIVPQFNLFLFSLPLKSLLGVMIVLCAFSLITTKIVHELQTGMRELLQLMEVMR